MSLGIGLALPAPGPSVHDEGSIAKPVSPAHADKHLDSPAATTRSTIALRETVTAEPVRRPLTCTDRNILPIWRYLRKVQEIYETEFSPETPADCAHIVDVHYADINGDGTAETLVRGKTIPLCGGVGNCDFWIFQKRGPRYRLLLRANDYFDRAEMGEQLLRSKTKGYADVLVKGHFTAAETSFTYYKFDGQRYRESNCLYEVHDYDSDNKIFWKFITCKEFDRRLRVELGE